MVYQVSCTTRVILNIFSIIHMGIHQGQTINMRFCCNLLRYPRENIEQKHPDCCTSMLVHHYVGHTISKPLISFTTDPTWFFVISPEMKFKLKGWFVTYWRKGNQGTFIGKLICLPSVASLNVIQLCDTEKAQIKSNGFCCWIQKDPLDRFPCHINTCKYLHA